MSKPANVHAFFSKLAAAAGTSNDQPSLKMLHTRDANAGSVKGSLQDIVTKALEQPKLFAIELRDYGVGLPPLAHG